MDLAIILAVSEYTGRLANLPGCARDAEVFETILRKESRFGDPLVIRKDTSSASVKTRIVDFVAQHKGKDVGELLFYFSGHGLFRDGEFFYLLSDYDPNRTKQTSLENTELDSLIKALTPNITVKIVDACQSGMSYVKDDDSFARYLKGSQDAFKTCYFLFSSQSDQSSYQDRNLSDFTKNIATCVKDHPGASVRYKDIIDHVSDAFAGNPSQTPFFIVQADFTDRFCGVDEPLRKALENLLTGGVSAGTPAMGAKPVGARCTLRDLVASEAQEYCSADEVGAILESFAKKLKAVETPEDLSALFAIEHEIGTDYAGLPSLAAIGKWIEKNDHNYFAEPVVETKVVPLEGMESMLAGLRATYPWEKPQKEKLVRRTIGVKATTDMPFRYVKVTAKPKFPNINRTACILLPLISKTRLAVFSAMLKYREAGWTEDVMEGQPNWQWSEIKLKDTAATDQYVNLILEKYWSFTLDPIRDRFGLLEKPKQEEGEESPVAEPAPPADGLRLPATPEASR